METMKPMNTKNNGPCYSSAHDWVPRAFAGTNAHRWRSSDELVQTLTDLGKAVAGNPLERYGQDHFWKNGMYVDGHSRNQRDDRGIFPPPVECFDEAVSIAQQ